MASHDAGPRCPGCGYSIFGIRDARCPECGRALDVRDFAVGERGSDARRYTRNTIIGGLVACLLLALLLVPLVFVAVQGARFGVVPLTLLLLIGALAIWLLRALGGVAQELSPRRTRRGRGR